eukprot:SM000008S22351  [mRNA]  locus=s8:1231426:1236253:+ [translate_table: standard]
MAAADPFCINVWSAPRSLNTSLMYSFAQRDDTQVLDEPLYAHYLSVNPKVQRPYREELLNSMDSDGNRVVHNVIHGPRKKKVLVVKHMAKHRTSHLDDLIITGGRHVLLLRDPLESLRSFNKQVPATLEELGFPALVQIFSQLRGMGCEPPVVLASDLQRNPEGTLRSLCASLSLSFDKAMLSWKAGPKSEDGLWASWWYDSVHKSTGFSGPSTLAQTPFPMELYNVLEEAQPFYEILRRHALQPAPVTNSEPEHQLHRLPPQLPVPRNEKLLVWVGDHLTTRENARVSVLDSIVQGGDGCWEGLRIYKGRVMKLEEHINRMLDSAKALAFVSMPTREEIKTALFSTLAANGMEDGAHVRLTLTRGKKVTSGMSPEFNRYGHCLIVLAEWKPPVYNNSAGIKLTTASTRRNPPQCVDSKIHHNNLINNILAKVEGNNAGADDALMLDIEGFVSETNATNVFMVKRGKLHTPQPDYCLPGITRQTVIDIALQMGLDVKERRISLSEFHSADEVFTTGTMGELSPVVDLDNRRIGDGSVGPITKQLQNAYQALAQTSGVPLPFAKLCA